MADINLSSLLKVEENCHIPRSDMNKLIMNYLVTEGFKEAAEKFRMESGIQPEMDLDTLDNRIKIREAIQKGLIQDAIALINSLYPELLDNNTMLLFRLQQQYLIELIRNKKVELALDFAQTYLAERGEESGEILAELERTMALLAFDQPETSPFGDLLHQSNRKKVASEVNAVILETNSRSKLENLLKLLLWAQSSLDRKNVKYAKMTDFAHGTMELSKD